MDGHLWMTIISWLSTTHLIHTTPNTLDISDYSFHFATYHYTLSTESTTIYNPQLDLNITIDFSPSTIALLINNHTLDLLNDHHLHEISTVSSLNTYASSTKRILQEEAYKVRDGIRAGKPFNRANQYCKATRRGHLATAHDDYDNSELVEICTNLAFKKSYWHCWIGLRRPFTTWIDTTAVDYTNWMPKEPANWKGRENCVEIYTDDNDNWGMWNDLDCSMARSFICEKREMPGDEPKYAPEGGCEDCVNQRWPGSEPGSERRRLMNCPTCGGQGGAARMASSERFRKKIQKESQEHWAKEHEQARQRMQKAESKARIRREARQKERRHRAAMRAHLRHLRRKAREDVMHDYKREQHFERRRDAGFRLLDKLIGSALGFSHGSGLRRRRAMAYNMTDIRPVMEMMARCKVMRNARGVHYEVCVNYNVADVFLSVDLRYGTQMVRKERGQRIDFRRDYVDHEGDDEEDRIEDAMERYLGYVVYKYDLMDWHRFVSEDRAQKYGYGE
eukprot:356846_1